MFCYCAKCANIKNVTSKTVQNEVCEVCGTFLQPVPQEYLMPNGSFFKSQAVRQQFIENIQSAPEYDEEIGGKKEEIKKAVEEQEKIRIEEMNEKMRQEQFHMVCPVCKSQNVQRISTIGKYAKVGVFGILGADDLGKTWKCNVCGSKF